MIDNIKEQWREFYLPYTFEELHNRQTNPTRSDLEDAMPLAKELNEFPTALRKVKTVDTLDSYDNPLEEEQYLQQHKYTMEKININNI